MWYYLKTEDLKIFKKSLPKNLYWKLSAQCRARIPMLKTAYERLKKQYQ